MAHDDGSQPQQQKEPSEPSSDSNESLEQKLPEQIMDHLAVEGMNLENIDVVHMANILATLRWDLTTLLNEDIDEFQFQLICTELLHKTSEQIKIKPPNKSQSQQPLPVANQINLDELYAHLKRQPCQQSEILHNSNTDGNDNDIDELPSDLDVESPKATNGCNVGEVIMGLCEDNQLLYIPQPNSNHAYIHQHTDILNNNNGNSIEEEPGQHRMTAYDHNSHVEELKDNESDAEENESDSEYRLNYNNRNGAVTLMGEIEDDVLLSLSVPHKEHKKDAKQKQDEEVEAENSGEEEDADWIQKPSITLMGQSTVDDGHNVLEFKPIAKCYQNAFKQDANDLDCLHTESKTSSTLNEKEEEDSLEQLFNK